MDRAALGVPSLAPPLRIERRAKAQLPHLPRLAQSVAELHQGFAGRAGALAQARLRALAEALWRSPRHLARLRERALSPDELRSFDDLRHFPALDRPELGAHWDALPAVDVHGPTPDGVASLMGRELVVVHSSGTTGAPVRVVRDAYECVHMWAVLRFWLERLGLALPTRPRVVLLDALPSGLEYSARLPALSDGALHRLSTLRPRTSERLLRVRPSVLFSDPAGLHWLLGQPALPAPALVLTSAQHFAADQRARLAERLPAPVLNYYATTETGPVAWECLARPGAFHALAPEVWLESEGGQLLVTRLRPSPLPLLRYRPGDAGQVSEGACACGFVGQTITGFGGRRACRFLSPGGADIDAWQLAWMFKKYPLRGFRMVQAGPERFEVEVAAGDPADFADLRARLEGALRLLGWAAPQVAVREGTEEAALKPEPFRRAWEPGS